jgi:predicted nucleic acid-binding protein
MSFLLDTDVISLLERKNCPAKLSAWIERHDDLFVSVVSLAELEFGLRQAPATHRIHLEHWLKETRSKYVESTEQLTETVLIRWKQLLVELRTKRRTMTCEDSLIAATALVHGHSVATRNKRHFEPSGVQVVDPLE